MRLPNDGGGGGGGPARGGAWGAVRRSLWRQCGRRVHGETVKWPSSGPRLRDGEDVGFFSPGHCPGCEQEEAAAHPGRPHPGEWPGRAVGRVTLVHLRPREEVTAARRPALCAVAASPPCSPCPGSGDKQARAGLLRGGRAPRELRFPGGRAPLPAGRWGAPRVREVPGPRGGPQRAGGATALGSRALRSSRSGKLGEGTRTSAPRGARGGRKLAGGRRASDVRATASSKPTPH